MNAGDPAFLFTELAQVDRGRGQFRCGRLALGGQGCHGRFHPGDGWLFVVHQFVFDLLGQPFQGGQFLIVLGNADVAEDALPGPAGSGLADRLDDLYGLAGELGDGFTRPFIQAPTPKGKWDFSQSLRVHSRLNAMRVGGEESHG